MKTYRKAVNAAVFMFAGTFGGLLADGDPSLSKVVIAVGAGLVAGAATYQIPNAG